jgi:hypothetical protein
VDLSAIRKPDHEHVDVSLNRWLVDSDRLLAGAGQTDAVKVSLRFRVTPDWWLSPFVGSAVEGLRTAFIG